MSEPTNTPELRWSTAPSVKQKTLLLKNVTMILDELAPERLFKHTDHLNEIQQYRTPTGCVLQAANCAISVSWFDSASKDAPLGELHVVMWDGMVKRRGSIMQGKGGTIVSELVLRPSQPSPDTVLWTATDGTEYATLSVAQKCQALLEELMATRRPVSS